MKEDQTEFIICAAIYWDDGKEYCHMAKNIKTGIVICGRRHHNCFSILSSLGKSRLDFKETQGFMTSKDRFLNRYDAAEIAFKAKQTSERRSVLYSEDLY